MVESGFEDARFGDFDFCPSVHEDITAAGFEKPTPIQAACMGPILEGKDVIGLAQTGTGKTAAFALPIINKLAGRMELGAVVLAPTRELAAQISEVFEKLGASSGVRVVTIVGGIPMEQDLKALRSWPNVLVATPGRLIDHLSGGTVSVNEVEVLTIDEADRMHDMGFIPQIRQIINRLPDKRQTLMFTATLSGEVEHVARQSMRDAVRIQVGMCVPVKNATQQLFELSEDDKTPKLLELLRQTSGRALVFLRTKRGVDRLARTLSHNHVRAGRLHGDMEQPARDKAMAAFRDGSCKILIATDIAARGIDVADIEHVINFDFPHAAEDYVHRVGRTARQEATGLATSFITKADKRFVIQVKHLLGDKMPPVQSLLRPGQEHSDSSKGSHGGSRGSHGGSHGGGSHGRHGAHSQHGSQGQHASHSAHGSHSTVGSHAHGADSASGVPTDAAGAPGTPAGEPGQKKRRRRRRGGRGRNKQQPQEASHTA